MLISSSCNSKELANSPIFLLLSITCMTCLCMCFLKLPWSFFSWNHVCNLGVLLILQVWLIHMCFLKLPWSFLFFSWNHVCNLGVLLILQVWLIHMFSIFLRRTVGKQSYQLLYHSTSHQFLVSKSVIRTVSQTINQSELYLKFKKL